MFESNQHLILRIFVKILKNKQMKNYEIKMSFNHTEKRPVGFESTFGLGIVRFGLTTSSISLSS